MNKLENMSSFCELVELARIRTFIKHKAISFGIPEAEADKVSLAVDEACTNLIKYTSNTDKNHEFCVTVEKVDDKIEVSISDDGKPFDPLSVERPNMEKYFKEFKRGGLGIHLMRSVMDEIEYFPADGKNSQNTLKLIKFL